MAISGFLRGGVGFGGRLLLVMKSLLEVCGVSGWAAAEDHEDVV